MGDGFREGAILCSIDAIREKGPAEETASTIAKSHRSIQSQSIVLGGCDVTHETGIGKTLSSTGAAEEGRRAGLLGRDIEAKKGSIRCTEVAQDLPILIDDGDIHLGKASSGLPDRRAYCVSLDKGLRDHGFNLLDCKATRNGAAPKRKPVVPRRVHGNSALKTAEGSTGKAVVGIRRVPYDSVKEGEGNELNGFRTSGQGAEGNGFNGIRGGGVHKGQPDGIQKDGIRPDSIWRFEPARAGERHDFFSGLVMIKSIAIDTVMTIQLHADPADRLSIFVEGDSPGISRKPQRKRRIIFDVGARKA